MSAIFPPFIFKRLIGYQYEVIFTLSIFDADRYTNAYIANPDANNSFLTLKHILNKIKT